MYKTIKLLEKNKSKMTQQQFKTLRGQCRAGDIDGAIKGLRRILRKRG